MPKILVISSNQLIKVLHKLGYAVVIPGVGSFGDCMTNLAPFRRNK